MLDIHFHILYDSYCPKIYMYHGIVYIILYILICICRMFICVFFRIMWLVLTKVKCVYLVFRGVDPGGLPTQ